MTEYRVAPIAAAVTEPTIAESTTVAPTKTAADAEGRKTLARVDSIWLIGIMGRLIVQNRLKVCHRNLIVAIHVDEGTGASGRSDGDRRGGTAVCVDVVRHDHRVLRRDDSIGDHVERMIAVLPRRVGGEHSAGGEWFEG